MANQHDRSGANDASSNEPAEPERKQSGGNMGAGRSGAESLGSEKPADRDHMGSKRPED